MPSNELIPSSQMHNSCLGSDISELRNEYYEYVQRLPFGHNSDYGRSGFRAIRCAHYVSDVFERLTLAAQSMNSAGMKETDSPTSSARTLSVREDAVRAAKNRIECDLAAARARVERLEAELESHTALLRLFAFGSDYLDAVQAPRGTIRDMLHSVLRAESGPISVSQMVVRMTDAFGVDVPRTSISPVLKRMEENDEVLHVGRRWKFNEEGPSAATDGPRDDVSTHPTKRRKTIMLG